MELKRLCIIDENGFYVSSTWENHPAYEQTQLEDGQIYVVSATPRAFNRPQWFGCGWIETDTDNPNPVEIRGIRCEIAEQNAELDRQTIPFIRKSLIGKLTADDKAQLEEIENKVASLKVRLKNLVEIELTTETAEKVFEKTHALEVRKPSEEIRPPAADTANNETSV